MIRNKCLTTAAAALATGIATALWAATGALAQSATVPMTVPEIKGCLCLQPRLQPLQDTWLARQKEFDEQQAQLTVIDQEVTSQRQRLDPNDLVGQQVLKDLLSQQQGLRDAIGIRYLPALNQARDAYNIAVEQYNGTCTRPRYAGDEAVARQDLVCPAP